MFSYVDPDYPEFIFGYNNLDTEFNDVLMSFGLVSSGIENRTGTVGSEYMGPYTDGLLVCYDYLDRTVRRLSCRSVRQSDQRRGQHVQGQSEGRRGQPG